MKVRLPVVALVATLLLYLSRRAKTF